MQRDYIEQYTKYFNFVKNHAHSNLYEHSIESSFESLNDWSLFFTLTQVKEWFLDKRKNAPMQVFDIPINEVKGWKIDNKTGNISHASGGFFTIHGIRVITDAREVGAGGWDQPILEQVDYDGGLLGIIRKRFEGIPHYLCEAKMEPGNYGKVQISPTLQATFSNLKKTHGGKKPHFADYFENHEEYQDIKVLFSAWLAEDGGRLHLKRNRGMLLEVPESLEIEIPTDNFIWLSLYQIKNLMKEDAWINPHIRGVLAHV